ncbi:MAG: hypothetical protein KC502_15415 [Myxococcales bacterium]|nr:hypothetical protein [Myxococcales bacterium]
MPYSTHQIIPPALLLSIFAVGCGQSQPTHSGGNTNNSGGVYQTGDAVLFKDTGAAAPDGSVADTGEFAPDSAGTDTTTATNDTASRRQTDATTATQDAGSNPGDDGSCPFGCDDGLPCTQEGCVAGSCTHKLQAGNCISAGNCVAAGVVPNNPCLSCKPEVSTLSLQPVTGATCDDGVACTTDDSCDAAGSCNGKPAPGCCKTDVDCVSGAPCLAAICDVSSGTCKTQPKAGCCQQGVCCDPTTFAPRLAGYACSTSSVDVEWACDGVSIRSRSASLGCDGVTTATCSAQIQHYAWSAWKTTQTCPQGQVCVLASKDKQPTCGVAPQCSSDVQCNDGKVCTQDLCANGKCAHPVGKSGVPCGTTAISKEYKCSSSQKGGAILVRNAVSSCDGVADTCPATSPKPTWGAWQTLKTCAFSEVCQVTDGGQPAKCVGAPKCQPGSTCCTKEGQFAAKSTSCGGKVIKTEAKCEGGKGGKLSIREATGGCSGGSTSCYTYVSSYLAWGPWKVSKQCAALETCETNYSKTSGQCSKKTQCSAGYTCCDKDGFYAAKGTACGTSPWKTEQKCLGSKGGQIQVREGWRGCTGTGTWCSSQTQDLVWKPFTTKTTCPATALCEVTWGTAKCVTACNAGQACCTAQGEFSAKGTTCGSWSVKTEQKCDSASKGGKVVERKALYGCSGNSATCSYSTTDYVWGEWKTKKACESWQSCAVKYGYPGCVSTCTPSQVCCTAQGDFASKGTACSSFVSSSETKCSGTGKGAKILKREAKRGCSGSMATCSYASSDYVWGPWVTKTTCTASQYCKGTYSQYCSSAP